MNTITVCAYNRPEYLQEVLLSLHTAMHLCSDFVSEVVIGIDPGGGREREVRDMVAVWQNVYGCHMRQILWPEHLGVSEHPRRLLQYTFNELSSDFNLHLEDDTVLSPDALRLCEWYRSFNTSKGLLPYGPHIMRRWNAHAWLCLHSASREGIKYDPALVVGREDFGVWGWACFKYAWENWMAPYWNHRREQPLGWDWSMTTTMQELGLYALQPALSRVRNIGREGGCHQTPEGYDRDFAGSLCADSTTLVKMEDFHL